AALERSMVREDAAARRAGARGLSGGAVPDRAGALARDVRALDGEHPRLEHLAPAVVGAPHSGVPVHAVRPPVGRPEGPGALPQVRRSRRAGPRRAGHVVFLVALAVRDAGLARPHARPGAVLSRTYARHGAGNSLLLGGPDADVGLPLHGAAAAVHDRVSTAPCATHSTARCPNRSATASTRSTWCGCTARTRSAG